jgi:outer membrane protein insertion porin family/translocation and assembly module TamA
LSPRQTFILPLTQARLDEPAYNLFQVRLAPRVERQLWPDVTASIGYNIEYDNLSDVPEETQETFDEYVDHGYVSSWTANIQRNTAGDLLNPRLGSVLTLSLEQAGGPWQGDFTFYWGMFEAKKYIGIWARQVLAGRFRIGAGDGFGDSDDLPMFRRFFSGGISGTRGYGRQKLGPLTSSGDPIGGRSLIEGSVELRVPVWGNFGGVVFFDAGAINEKPFRYDVGDLQFGTGPGIRYETPIGPLRLDIGFPIDPPHGEPSWQIHFSIGQAF